MVKDGNAQRTAITICIGAAQILFVNQTGIIARGLQC